MDIYNIDSLASLSGVSRRTIHYYIQRGVLEPPEGGGRGAFYTGRHLRALKRIQALAAQGVPLFYMKEALEQADRASGNGETSRGIAASTSPTSAPSAAAPADVSAETPAPASAVNGSEPAPSLIAHLDCLELAEGVQLTWTAGAISPEEAHEIASFTRGLIEKRIERRNGNDKKV